MKPSVSVIIPVYNRLDILPGAVNSVLTQTYQDFEIILVDDGSDEPLDRILSLDERIRLIRHEHNRGPSAARNTGVDAARGDLIAFLDSDDEWMPAKLDRQVQWMNAHPATAACAAGYYYYTEEGKSIEIPAQPKNWKRALAQGVTYGPGTTLMVRKVAIEQVRFNDALRRYEDLDWGLRFVDRNWIDILQEPLAVVHRGRRPAAQTVEMLNTFLVNTYAEQFLALGPVFGRQCIGKRWLEVAVHYYREKNFQKGWFFLRKAWRIWPFQRPGMYLRILDYYFGSSWLVRLKKIRQQLFWRNIDTH